MADKQLRAEVVERVRRALAEAGGRAGDVNQAEIVREFLARGGKRTTLFAWVKRALEAVPDEQAVARATAAADEALTTIPLSDEGRQLVVLPAARFDGLGAMVGPAGGGLVDAMESCIQVARDLMAHARNKDGSVRLAKTLLNSSEHLRKVAETMARIQEAIVNTQKIDAFYQALMQVLERHRPEIAQQVLALLVAGRREFREQAGE